MKKNIYALIDSETSKMTDIYNLAIIIFDKKGNILFERDYLNLDVFANENMMENAYYKDKMPMYKKDKNIVRLDTRSMLYDFQMVLKLYEVTHLLAYNLQFDINAINKTYEKFCNRIIDFNKYELIDVMRIVIETKLNTNKYRNFCLENNFLTPKGYYSTNAENAYRYLTGNLDFIEEHTALSDCYCEKEIFMNCLKQKKTISKGLKGNLWKIIQDK